MSSTFSTAKLVDLANSPDAKKELDHYVVHEVGPRWFEPVDKADFPTKSGAYELKVMRSVRTRYYYKDRSNSLSASKPAEVPGIRRSVWVTPETTIDALRNGSRIFKHVLISHLDGNSTFSGQMTIHTDGKIALTGYRGGSI